MNDFFRPMEWGQHASGLVWPQLHREGTREIHEPQVCHTQRAGSVSPTCCCVGKRKKYFWLCNQVLYLSIYLVFDEYGNEYLHCKDNIFLNCLNYIKNSQLICEMSSVLLQELPSRLDSETEQELLSLLCRVHELEADKMALQGERLVETHELRRRGNMKIT